VTSMERNMVRLRLITLMGDFALIAYATGLYLALLFVLHAVALPVNALRLWQATPAF
jgi:hypothetical protein